MHKVNCLYYCSPSGKHPVREFVDSLDIRTQQKFFFSAELLAEFGRKLTLPHARYIGNDIFELRFRGREGHIRILYFFYQSGKAILTNGFIKKRGKTPKKEIRIAVERKIEYFSKIKRSKS